MIPPNSVAPNSTPSSDITTEAESLEAFTTLRKAWGPEVDADDFKGPLTADRLALIVAKTPQEPAPTTSETQPSILSDLLRQKEIARPSATAGKSQATSALPRPPRLLASNSKVSFGDASPQELTTLRSLEGSQLRLSTSNETPLIFDIPVTYNARVSQWIHYFQTDGRKSFQRYLERSSRFLPVIEEELTRAGLPQDLVYVAMVESGFRADAVSHAAAIGLWQFIVPTGQRYGLAVEWWIDERRDFHKSTKAAIQYMSDLYQQFNSWYLVAASYNMGETRVRRLIEKHKTNDFWALADRGLLPRETTDYVPKIIAAMLISKAPALYGFRDLEYQMPLAFETARVPGGTDLINLAGFLGVSERYLQELNPELIKGFIPRDVSGHTIRIPKGSATMVSQYIRDFRQAAN